MFEIKDVKYFSCHDFTDFVKEYYGKDVDVLSRWAEIYGNETFVDIKVCKEHPDDGWYVENKELWNNPGKVIQWWIDDADEFYSMFDKVYVDENIILWDLCRKGVIPEGHYVMRAYW
jgi:hypothetical protein